MELKNLINKNKDEKEKLTETQAYDLLKVWADDLEVRLTDDDFEEVQKELFKAVVNERLTYDSDKEEFTYALRKPIEQKDGGKISIIKIHDCEMGKKREMTKQKNEVDRAISMIQIYSSYQEIDEQKEIPIGFIGRLKSTDQNVILAVILGFFVQAVPGVQ